MFCLGLIWLASIVGAGKKGSVILGPHWGHWGHWGQGQTVLSPWDPAHLHRPAGWGRGEQLSVTWSPVARRHLWTFRRHLVQTLWINGWAFHWFSPHLFSSPHRSCGEECLGPKSNLDSEDPAVLIPQFPTSVFWVGMESTCNKGHILKHLFTDYSSIKQWQDT